MPSYAPGARLPSRRSPFSVTSASTPRRVRPRPRFALPPCPFSPVRSDRRSRGGCYAPRRVERVRQRGGDEGDWTDVSTLAGGPSTVPGTRSRTSGYEGGFRDRGSRGPDRGQQGLRFVVPGAPDACPRPPATPVVESRPGLVPHPPRRTRQPPPGSTHATRPSFAVVLGAET